MSLKFAEFKKIKVRYTDTGKGRVLVLLHGFLGSHKMWDEYVSSLSGQFRVITIDLPGHGETPAIGYYHSMEMMAQCVKTVLDEAGVRRYVLAGHSMGGYVALAFAELFPENLKGLCLVHSTSYPDSADKKTERNKVISLVKKGHKRAIAEIVINLFTPEKITQLKNKVNTARRMAESTSEQSIINSLEGMKERKSRDLILKFSEYPVMFIVGKKDTLINYDTVFSQVGLCKYPFVIMMEEEGHMGFYETPKQILPEFAAFTNRCFKKNF